MTIHQPISAENAASFSASPSSIESALRAIPPAWPLASSVAVNPYLGQSGERLASVGARLARVGGLPVTMPASWYGEKITSGIITDSDIIAAIKAVPNAGGKLSLEAIKAAAQQGSITQQALPTIADLAAIASGIDWPALIAERIGVWAAVYFDEGQSLWGAPQNANAFANWRVFATHDLTPEIAGLSGFAAFVSSTPDNAANYISRATETLLLPHAAQETYFHQLLMTLGGWAQYARYQLWQAELRGQTNTALHDVLAIRLMWDEALFSVYGPKIAEKWMAVLASHSVPVAANQTDIIDEILQEAAERAAQRGLIETFATQQKTASVERPALQAAFCIDVRSEVFRRALEATNPKIQTLGFAGFFGLTTSHKRFASDVAELRLPVLLNPGVYTCSGGPADETAAQEERFKARAKRAWGRFKMAAVSSFAFVEAMGPVYVGKLLRDSLKLKGTTPAIDPAPQLNPALDLPSLINAGETILRAMSMTTNFARLIVMAGHGANVVNNPHASALHCGACGGYSGEVNARLLASLLNSIDVRDGLVARGIIIPADTLFMGALHDTTTDGMLIYEADFRAPDHAADLKNAKQWFAAAGVLTRTERALRFPGATREADVITRSLDWSQVRPEWALAGCKAFIAAPRRRTSGKNLQGRAFLHDYDWSNDKGFGVLELIMTAPVVVASWISLQYYGSTIAPQFFGGGNKLLHNVAGGIGVLEGNGGVLRTGLPWQSVHDGENFAHEPLRLSVCIEAPREAMSDILGRHDGVRALFDNRWLHLFAIDENGHIAWRYTGDLQWEKTGEH